MTGRLEPTFFVIVQEEGGDEVKLDLTDRVLSLTYKEEEDKTDTLTLAVRNWDLSNFDDPIWKPGNTLYVAWGYDGNMGQQRTCVISKVTGSTELSIEAQGAETASMNRHTRTRRFEDKKRSEIVEEILQEHGFDTTQLHVEDTVELVETITQAGLTDYQFLRRLADIEGFQLFADVDGMHFEQRRMSEKPVRTLVWFPYADNVQRADDVQEAGDILDFNIETDIFFAPKQKAGKVTIRARDPITKEDITVVASEAETTRDKTAPLSLVVDQDTSDAEGGSGAAQATQVTEDISPSTLTTEAAVKREADGRFRTQQNNTVELTMTIVGDPTIMGKTIVEVLNISQRYSGLYYVKGCEHALGGGYTTTLKLSSDGVNSIGKVGGSATTTQSAATSAATVNPNKGVPTDPNALTQQPAPAPPFKEDEFLFYESGGG